MKFTEIVVYTTSGEFFSFPYDENKFNAFYFVFEIGKGAVSIGGYMFNIKNVVAIRRV